MFATLKNKIKEETGKEVIPQPVRMGAQGRLQRSAFGSTSSQFTDGMGGTQQQQYAIEQKDVELAALRLQCGESTVRADESGRLVDAMRKDIERLEESNRLLEESLKVAQTQKELICNEQDQIQNIQLQEIAKLKSLLNFREQEAVDQLATLKQHQHQVDKLKAENQRLRLVETQHDDMQDEYEKFKHSAQLERNTHSTAMAVLEEQNRHLCDKVHVLEDTHAQFTGTLDRDDQHVQRLLAERRTLEQRLEEAHLHLSDIKSTWSAQNLALETQVSRLSHQVAAETTEKRKALHSQDDQVERLKTAQFELECSRQAVAERDNKIRVLIEEIDDLQGTLSDLRTEFGEEVQFQLSNVKQAEEERDQLRSRLEAAERRATELDGRNDAAALALRDEIQREATDRLQLAQIALDRCQETVLQRDDNIRAQVQAIDDLQDQLHRQRIELSEAVQSLQSNVLKTEEERDQLRNELDRVQARVAQLDEQSDEAAAAARTQTQTLRDEMLMVRDEMQRLSEALETETAAHRTTALKNAEISQAMAKIMQDLNDETAELAEATDTIAKQVGQLAERDASCAQLQQRIAEMEAAVAEDSDRQSSTNVLQKEVAEKNKEIKILKQRLVDFKKTLQDELKSAQQSESALIDVDVLSPFSNHQHTNGSVRRSSNQGPMGGAVVGAQPQSTPTSMDEVNFMYLKHVIMKFLTCRDVEARQLVRAVATLLHLSKDEEKLLHNSVEHKGGWFSIKKPDLGIIGI